MRRAGLTLLLMLLPWAGAAENLYVQSRQAELHESPGLDAPVTAKVPRGTILKMLEARDRWYRVIQAGSEGWVFRYLVAKHPPLKKETVLGGNSPSIREKARRRASGVAAAGAARGLTATERQRARTRNEADYAALERLDSLKLPEGAVAKFMAGDRS